MQEKQRNWPEVLRQFAFSLLSPKQVHANQNAGLLRLPGCLFMVIDHFGKMLFPQIPEMRLIGRLAFPLYAYGIAVGAIYTKHPLRYLQRVVLLALVSQPIYAVALGHTVTEMYAVSFARHPIQSAINFYLKSYVGQPSILVSLSLGLAILLSLRERQWGLALGLYVFCECIASHLDYGIGGIRLMIIFYVFAEHPLLMLAAAVSYMISWARGGQYVFFGQHFAMRIYSLPAIALVCLPVPGRLRLPKWFNYAFYPAHLVILLACEVIF